jgi:hypothetical protein
MILTPGARDWCRRNAVTEERLTAILARPKSTTLDPQRPDVRRCFGDGLMVVVAPDGVVLAVSRSIVGVPEQRQPRGKRTKGGQTWPTSWSEMRRRILAAGLIVVTGSVHDKVCHPDTGEVLGILPHGERHSRGGYAAHKDLGKALLAAGFDLRNQA